MATPSDRWAEIAQGLGRVEGKVDSLILARAEDREKVNKLEGRVNSLERRMAYGLGIATAISTGLTSFFTYLFHGLK